jgi:signal transduction histidine kinase
VIEVWDQGVGIAPDQLRNVFLEFYKVEGTEGNAEGFGLGLAIVARLAHALKIRVNVRSHPGRGTVFRLVVGHAQRLNRSR